MLKLSHLKSLATVFFAAIILSACGGGGDAAAPAAAGGGAVTCNENQFNDNGTCVADAYTPKVVTDFQTDEYSKSGALSGVKTAEAYANIESLVDADNNRGNVTQAGAGQMISLVSNGGFNTSHQEFSDGTNDGAVFDSVLTATGTAFSGTDITSDGAANCASTTCYGTRFASLIAGRKGGTATGDLHGIAYNAKIKAIIGDNSEAQIINSLTNGVGSDIIAMNHVWQDETTTTLWTATSSTTYNRPLGKNIGKVSSSSDPERADSKLSDTELMAWRDAVDPNGSNNTIMVFGAGDNGLNSQTGKIAVSGNTNLADINTIVGKLVDGNVPAFRAAYPALYTEMDDMGTTDPNDDVVDDFTSDRWLVVTGLDASDVISTTSNGCGVAMGFCLSAPGQDIHTANSDGGADDGYTSTLVSGTEYASSTVAGALAVLKGAFPNATPEKLTELVLDTADYIALTGDRNSNNVADEDENGEVIGGSTNEENLVATINRNGADHKYNVVYGFGKLDLQAATTASVVSSYVTASNNQSIGALWTDTKLTLSSHFGGNFESVTFGIGDAYGRHFITAAPQTSYAPVAVSLDDYMANMLADNVQTQKLGGQAQANYSNSGEQSWMNLEYISGNATTKIAFQDSYKISPLSDTGTTTILRANNIRPASNNIGMMDVDYKLGNLTLSSYAARGEYDTGYKFDELGTDFDVNYKDSHLNIAIGNIREHGQFLGTNTSGAYALNAPTVSRFTDVTYGHNVGNKFNIYANYINYETDVDMLHDQFASIDGLQADQYQIGFTGKDIISKDDSLNVALITKLGVTDGSLNQNSTLGYTADGAFNNASQSYDLAVSDRHQQFEITYQGKLYQNADKISALRDNRFFTSIIVDSNLNHVQGASQVEVISGINIRY